MTQRHSTDRTDPAAPTARIGGAETLTARERAFHAPILATAGTPAAPFAGALLRALAALLAGGIAWASIGEMEIVASAPGQLIPEGRVKVLQTIEPAWVRAIHVREGQHVEAGQLLLELDPTMAQADLDSSHQRLRQNREQAARLAAELGARPGAASLSDTQQATRDAREAAHAATLSAARAAVQEKTRALAAARSVETKLRLNLELASRRYAQNLVLFKEGFFSEAERMKQQQEVLSLQHDLAAHVETLAQLQAALDEARHRQTMVEQERRVQILAEAEQAAREGYALQAEYDKAERMNAAKTLLAPVAGIVQSLGVSTLGSAVAANQPLVTLVPDGMPLIAEVQLSNQDIGYVKAGQVVELKLDSFPFTQYGTVEGRVSWISADAELQNGASSGSAPAPGAQRAQGLSYRVHITPTGPALLRRGEPVRLQAGMSLRADIQTDRRKLIRFILDPLQKGLGEGLRVR